MHKLAEKMAECLKAKVEGMGIDNIEGQNLVELGMWVDILKDLACYDKDMRIIKAMDEEEESGEWEEDDGRRGYRGQPRSKTSGRYMRRGDGRRSRRGYDEPMEDYIMAEMYPMEYYRDMDRDGMGRMYYTGGGTSGGSGMGGNSSGMSGGSSSGASGGSSGGMRGYSEGGNYGRYEGRDSREGRSGQSRRGYRNTEHLWIRLLKRLKVRCMRRKQTAF